MGLEEDVPTIASISMESRTQPKDGRNGTQNFSALSNLSIDDPTNPTSAETLHFIKNHLMDKFIDTQGYTKTEADILYLYQDVDPSKTYNVLLVEENSSWKDRMHAVGMLLAEFAQETSLSCPHPDKKMTKYKISLKQAETLRTIGRFLGHFFNSTSWVDGEIHEYDEKEFLKRIIQIHNTLQS